MRQPDPPYVNRHSSSLADWDSALEKIPAHRKLVLVRIPEEANTNSLLFTPGCEDGAVALADVFIEGGLVTLLVENREKILDAGLQLLCQDPDPPMMKSRGWCQ